MPDVKDGEWVRPVMSPEFYLMECCKCGCTHKMEFQIDPVEGFRMRGWRMWSKPKCDAS
jgi:hypothetical protein